MRHAPLRTAISALSSKTRRRPSHSTTAPSRPILRIQCRITTSATRSAGPASAELHTELASLLHETDDLDMAEAACRTALALNPAPAQAHNTLGNIRRYQGQITDAVASYRHALDMAPDAASIHSNLLFTLQFASRVGPDEILAESRRWAARHEAPLAGEQRPHDNDRTNGRCLRIGYVCSCFHLHSAAFYLLPVLAQHDPTTVEVFCYSGDIRPDEATERFRALGHVWREIAGMSDAELAMQVRADGIDVLVDIALHMADPRLLAFARKPTPVQVTWLGYPGTTGLDAMDYRLTDPILNPPGVSDAHYTERSICLPQTFWSYAQVIETPAVSSLPALATGSVTFGCFNNFFKATPVASRFAIAAQSLVHQPSGVLNSEHFGDRRSNVDASYRQLS